MGDPYGHRRPQPRLSRESSRHDPRVFIDLVQDHRIIVDADVRLIGAIENLRSIMRLAMPETAMSVKTRY